MQSNDFRVVLVTVPEPELARKIALGLVESKLAACVTELPQATSHYRWEGKLESTAEVLLLIKTRSGLFASLTRYIKSLHSAKVPEIVSLVIDGVDPDYLHWLGANTQFARPTESNLPL